MNNTFSLNRIGLLLQRYFFENINREIIFWGFITFLFTALDHRSFVLAVLFISGLASSSHLQKEFFRGNNTFYILLPATHFEKLTAAILLNTVYHFIMTLICYAIGNFLVILLYHMLLKIDVPVNWDVFLDTKTQLSNGVIQISIQNIFWIVVGYFTLSQAMFMLGTLYFKKLAVLKTGLTFIGIAAFLLLIQITLFKSLWDIKYLSNAIIPTLIMIKNSLIPDFIKQIINYAPYALFPVFWVVSYFKLIEKQAPSR